MIHRLVSNYISLIIHLLSLETLEFSKKLLLQFQFDLAFGDFQYNTGINRRGFNNVDVTSPSMITIAIGCSIFCPSLLPSIGMVTKANTVVKAVIRKEYVRSVSS